MTEEPFHQHLDRATAETWEAIFALPFLARLADGTLEEDRFAWFIKQDVHYLDIFARVLARGAELADDAPTRAFLEQGSENVRRVEEALHATLAPRLGIDMEALRATEPAAVTVAYTDHLQRVASHGPLGEVVAAVLPCYWVYGRVGERLIASPPPSELYAGWVRTYASPEFASSVERQIANLDRLAAAADEATRARMERWFRRSLRYEWMFWDQADRKASWP
ncbi:MAG: thiaminase II, partial [Dehalococcoidia bacterium]